MSSLYHNSIAIEEFDLPGQTSKQDYIGFGDDEADSDFEQDAYEGKG